MVCQHIELQYVYFTPIHLPNVGHRWICVACDTVMTENSIRNHSVTVHERELSNERVGDLCTYWMSAIETDPSKLIFRRVRKLGLKKFRGKRIYCVLCGYTVVNNGRNHKHIQDHIHYHVTCQNCNPYYAISDWVIRYQREQEQERQEPLRQRRRRAPQQQQRASSSTVPDHTVDLMAARVLDSGTRNRL